MIEEVLSGGGGAVIQPSFYMETLEPGSLEPASSDPSWVISSGLCVYVCARVRMVKVKR